MQYIGHKMQHIGNFQQNKPQSASSDRKGQEGPFLLKFREGRTFRKRSHILGKGRTFYSDNLHNIVGSVLSVTLMALFGGI